jgi:hypothetical protein
MTKFPVFGSMEITPLRTKLNFVGKKKKEQLGASKQRKDICLENRKKGSHIVNDSICLRLNLSFMLHRKKSFSIFPSPAGMSVTKLSLAGIITTYINYSCLGRV